MSTMIRRQIVIDTETTGINKFGVPYEGHNIIEIGALEIVDRNLTDSHFHVYIKPNRLIDSEALAIHGITNEFLADKPNFSEVADDFLNFIKGSELIMHNAPFDLGFINYEFSKLKKNIPLIETICHITDSLLLAKKLFPGKRNNLDALCNRYKIDNSKRILHGALLDASILAKVYIAMTGGQISLSFLANSELNSQVYINKIQKLEKLKNKLIVIYANHSEKIAHEEKLNFIEHKIKRKSVWRLNLKKDN
ncbi:MAG: DNA polymerase III subunit epsilon [Arsenophonus sp.]|nr:MAG: DNA polymerase III subunit epsilon [Arsenophonus sp.]